MTKTETHSNKTILRVLLAAAAVLLLCGAVFVGGVAGAVPETVTEVSTLDGLTSAVTNDFNVKLTENIELTETLNITTTGVLDLNGYVLSLKSGTNGSVIMVDSYGNLTLTDSNTGSKTHRFTNTNGLYVWDGDAGTGAIPVTGGCITGGNSSTFGGGGVYVAGTSAFAGAGTFRMSGGNIVGNTATNGGGVYVASASIPSGVGGTFEMSGGNIEGNTATNGGGGVAIWDGATFEVSGTPVIKGNMKGEETNNVLLKKDNQLTLTASLTDGEIRITEAPGGLVAGNSFGTAAADASGAEHFVADVAPTADPLVGNINENNTLVWKKSESPGPGPGPEPEPTYTVTIAVDSTDSYGTVSQASVTGVSSGTQITSDDNTVTIGSTTVTATPNADTEAYSYAFDHWDNGDATVTSDMTVTAHFKQTQKPQTPVAEVTVDETSTSYSDIGTAWTAATTAYSDGSEVSVKLLADVVETNSALEVPATTSGNVWTLDLNGKVLKCANDYSEVIKVGDGGNLTVKDDSTATHYFQVSDESSLKTPWEYTPNKEGDEKPADATAANTIALEDIDSYNGEHGWAKMEDNKYVYTYVTVTGGCITGGHTVYRGGGVYIWGSNATFTLSGGNIVGNYAEEGGGLYFQSSGGKFTMNAGNIVGNYAASSGGGVRAHVDDSEEESGTFEMNGGRIVGNTSDNGGAGGGVYVHGNTIFRMTNGSIVGNSSGSGGGGGVAIWDGATFEVSGTPVIKGNKTNETANNVKAVYDKGIKLTGPLTGGEIRITKVGTADPAAGNSFGTTSLSAGSGEEHFVADGTTPQYVGSIDGTNLVWAAPKPTTATVTFDMQGHGAAIEAQVLEPGSKVTKPADPTAAGYTFGGWYTDSGCTAGKEWNFSTPVTKSMTLFAKWTANACTVTFDVQGHGTAPAAQTVNHGSKVTKPADPSAIGCVFGGWFTTSDCSVAYDFDTPVTGNMTLYAKWDIVSYTAKVEDYTYGGTVPQPYVTPADPADVSFYYIRDGLEYPWNTLTPTTLDAGSYYVRAVDNTGAVEIKDSSFTVNKAEQVKPDISVEAVADGIKTTITNYMSGYTYLYRLDAKNWELVPAGSSSFTIPGLDAETPYTVAVKINAKGNYKESISDSKTVTTLGTFSVSYNANGGVGTIEPQTATKGESITVASSSGISRNGYTFTVWNTKPDGTGDSFTAGVDPIDYGAVLYAQWTPKSYTLTLDGNGGKITGENRVNVQSTYGDSINLSEYPAVHSGSQNHVGWALTPGSKSALYAPNQKVQNLGDITLYAVWANKAYGLTVHVQNEGGSPVEGATVTLKLGSASFQGPAWSSSDGTVSFDNVPVGTYTLVAEKDGKTVTIAVTVDADQSAEITFPASDVNSIVDVKEGTPAIIVDGAADLAANSAQNGKSVTVTVTVETKTEGAPASGNPDDQETQIEIKQIKNKVKEEAPAGSTTEYLGIDIEKLVQESGKADEKSKISSTANVLEFLIPYDFSGKNSVILYRCHEGSVVKLKKINTRMDDTEKRIDGTYYPDTANGIIYLYSSLFSTYGVNYSTSDSPTPSRSSSSSGSSTWLQEPVPAADEKITSTDVTAAYAGIVFIPASPVELRQIEAVNPAYAELISASLKAAENDGVSLTNSKGAKVIITTPDEIPGIQKEVFAQVIDVASADGTKVTTVPFKVRLSDLTAKSLTTDDVTLYHYLEAYGLWIPLETRLVSTDSTYAYYEAATDGASPFGVLLKKLDAPEVQPVPTQAGKTPVPVAGVLAGLGAAAVVFAVRMRRK